MFSIGLNRAVSVIAEKQSKGKAGRGGTPAALKDAWRASGRRGDVTVRDGKYGPYVNFGKINATLPKGKDPMSVTLEEALALIAEREAKGGGGKSERRAEAGRQEAQRRSRPRRKKE